MILALASHEIRRLLRTRTLWLLFSGYAFFLAYLLLGFIEHFTTSAVNSLGVSRSIITPVFLWSSLIGHALLPLFAGRLFPEEYQKNTWPLLASAPMTGWELTLGKYLGLLCIVSLLSLLPLLMTSSLVFGSALDWGLVLSGWLGAWLSMAAFAAAVLYFSSLSREPLTATLIAFGALLLLIIIHISAGTSSSTGLYELSPLKHLKPLISARLNAPDLMYFLGMGTLCLWLTCRHLRYKMRHDRT